MTAYFSLMMNTGYFINIMDYCRLCGNIGHPQGLCTTDTVELRINPGRPCKTVELFTSVTQWAVADFMIQQSPGVFSIHKGFPVGTHQFKFRLDGTDWVTSDLFPTTTVNGNTNNVLTVHWKNGESVLVNFDYFTLLTPGAETKLILDVKILLNEISIREMFDRAKKPFQQFDYKVTVWGSWNDWTEGEEMTGICDKGVSFTYFILFKRLPLQHYTYKFMIRGLWMLDPFREQVGNGDIKNHSLNFDSEIEQEARELRQPIIRGTTLKVTHYFHEKLRDFDLIGHSLTTIGGKLFMFGGKDRDSFTNNVFRIEFNPFKVKQLEMLDSNGPSPIGFHKALKYGEKLIIYGGHDNKRVSDSYHTYSTLRNQWTRYKFQKPLVREMYSVVYRRFSSRIYIFGGLYASQDDEAEIHYDDLHVLFLNYMQFKRLKTKSPPCGRYGHSATLVGWEMYVFGGCRSEGMRKTCFNDLYRINLFNHDCLEWERVTSEGPRPSPRFGHLCLQFGTQMLVYGGYNEKMLDNLLGDFWVYEMVSNQWTELKFPEFGFDYRRAFQAGYMLQNSLIIFGGKMAKKNQLVDKFLKIDFEFN